LRRSQALAGIALAPIAALSACAPHTSGIVATKGSPQHPTAFGCQIYRSDDVTQALTLLDACGSKLVRVTANNIDFPYFDALFTAANKRGMRVIVISDYAPQPVDLTAYTANAVAFHRRYAAYDPIWELWNEPNLAHYWGAPPDRDAYARLAIATATALRNAGAREILSGGTSGIDATWIYDLRTRGVFDVVTGCAVHSYKDPSQALSEYIQAVSLLPPAVKLYTTEACVDTSRGQPAFFQDMWYVHRLLNLPAFVWCEFRDGTAGLTPPYTDPLGIVTADYQPKDVYRTAQSLVLNG
jgi:hypothetical protein